MIARKISDKVFAIVNPGFQEIHQELKEEIQSK